MHEQILERINLRRRKAKLLGELFEKWRVAAIEGGFLLQSHEPDELRIVHQRPHIAEWAALPLVIGRIWRSLISAFRGFRLGLQRGELGIELALVELRIQVLFLQGGAQGDELEMLIPSQDHATECGEHEKNKQIVSG